ncbi:MAG: alpha-glucosidase, partial [Oscillospiraceae bacterium]|nr:alpha-glucosidase [Oscillospiraceae bacterium]
MSEWWRDRVAYQIYPRSFQDSNGDGIGDIRGIISRLDYIKSLGAGIVWLSPVYCSPQKDNGYDISDYYDIDPIFGTMADMEELFAEAEKRDIKIVMDLVVNHTSDQHEWFQKSRDKNSEYRDYYIWKPGRAGGPPNNWTGFFSEPAWEYDEESGEYYLHLFTKEQPDLNYRNPRVIEEVERIMRFWLDKGAAGFRCDVINAIWKSSFEDGKKQPALVGMEHFAMQDGVHDILKKLREDVLSKYDCFAVGETALTTVEQAKLMTDKNRGELDMVFGFEHMDADCFYVKYLNRRFKAARLARILARWQGALEWNANYLENHDQCRSVSRFGDTGRYWEASAKLLCTLLLSLKGTPFIYQGEELGMTNTAWNSLDEINDVESRNVYK